MRSTFMGLEASRKGLFVQQSALYTTGHNISNANTEGYTRQRVNMQATPGFPYPGLNSPQYPGHMGTGVEASSIQRMRDEFTDRQYRQETNKLGYWDSTLKSINQMEDILSEPSEFGINQAFTEFWKGFQDVSANPDDSAARKVAIAKAEALADAFNYNYTQLETIQGNLGNEIFVANREINTILEKIASINAQVQALEPNGYVTNDLYDARDLLIDELNEYLPVKVDRVPSGGMASEVAEGSVRVTYDFVDANGTRQSIALVNGKHFAKIDINGATDKQINGTLPAEPFKNIIVSDSGKTLAPGQAPQVGLMTNNGNGTYDYSGDGEVVYENLDPFKGKLTALFDTYGYSADDGQGNIVTKGLYPEMMADLDRVAKNLVQAFNEVHKGGFTLNPAAGSTGQGGDFFDAAGTTAKTIKVNADVIKDPNLIAASSGYGEEGNGKWAMVLSNLQFSNIGTGTIVGANVPRFDAAGNPVAGGVTLPADVDLDGFTFQDFYKGLIGDLAVQGSKAKTQQFNSQTQHITVSNNRASHNSVSLDEEMTNMITFQQAYNANARMITVVDETLDKIINGMGRVGL